MQNSALVRKIREHLTIIQGESELATEHLRVQVAQIDKLLRQIEATVVCAADSETCPVTKTKNGKKLQ